MTCEWLEFLAMLLAGRNVGLGVDARWPNRANCVPVLCQLTCDPPVTGRVAPFAAASSPVLILHPLIAGRDITSPPGACAVLWLRGSLL